MKASQLLWSSLLLGGLLAAGGGLAWRQLGPMRVETAHPMRGPAVRAVYAAGTVEATVMLPIAPRGIGRLVELSVEEGAQVKVGQTLARLEDTDLKPAVDELEARARFAKTQLERAQNLLDRGLGTVLERDRARSEAQAADAAVARARALRGFMTLIAPADGQILQREGEIGQIIPANQPVFYFARRAPLRIAAEVDEEDILLVQPGQRVLIRAPALPDRILEGRVADITPKGNPATRGYRVRITFVGETPLRIGMTAETNIIVAERANALLAPSTAVRDAQVWIVRDGLLRHQPVILGFSGEARIEIVAGITEQDLLLVNPAANLRAGRRARPLPAAPLSAPAR